MALLRADYQYHRLLDALVIEFHSVFSHFTSSIETVLY